MSYSDKESLRKELPRRISLLTMEEKELSSQTASQRLISSSLWESAKCILLFASTEKEPPSQLLASSALASEKRIAYPRTTNAKGEMELRLVSDISQLHPGRWNILEPSVEECPVCAPEEIDLALIPGVAFDRRGYRLGHGGGYYDRLLGNPLFKATKVGYFFSIQEVDSIPTELHDQKLDWILTERELFKVS